MAINIVIAISGFALLILLRSIGIVTLLGLMGLGGQIVGLVGMGVEYATLADGLIVTGGILCQKVAGDMLIPFFASRKRGEEFLINEEDVFQPGKFELKETTGLMPK